LSVLFRRDAAGRLIFDAERARAISRALAEGKVDRGLPKLTKVDEGLPNDRIGETNPNPSERGRNLSPRQLAGARLIAQGVSTPEVAAKLGVSRQAVWKWTRLQAFRDEVRALHRVLAARGIG
jgi:DNA-binding NarL/FixJ family response regulator